MPVRPSGVTFKGFRDSMLSSADVEVQQDVHGTLWRTLCLRSRTPCAQSGRIDTREIAKKEVATLQETRHLTDMLSDSPGGGGGGYVRAEVAAGMVVG